MGRAGGATSAPAAVGSGATMGGGGGSEVTEMQRRRFTPVGDVFPPGDVWGSTEVSGAAGRRGGHAGLAARAWHGGQLGGG